MLEPGEVLLVHHVPVEREGVLEVPRPRGPQVVIVVQLPCQSVVSRVSHCQTSDPSNHGGVSVKCELRTELARDGADLPAAQAGLQ